MVGGDLNRALTEGAAQNTATGTLEHLHARPDNDTFRAQTGINGTYGVFTLERDGAWTYTLDNDRAATRALGEGITGEDSFPVASNARAGIGAVVTITITGVNSRPTATILAPADNTAVGLNSGLPVEGMGSDPDAGETATLRYFWRTLPMGLGSFVAHTAASTLWQSPAEVTGDGTVQLELTVFDNSGVRSNEAHTVSVTVVTTADTIIGGSLNGAVAVNGRDRASGLLVIANGAPGDPVTFVNQTSPGDYGLFALATDGRWTYTLNPALSATIALAAGEIGTDSFPVAGAGAGGALSGMVVIRVTGGNDAPSAAIAAPSARVTLESRETLMVGSGATDPDSGETATLRYQWSTIPAGRGAFDNDAGAQTIWTAPTRPIGSSGQNTTLVLTATDTAGLSDTATTVVTVVGATDLQPSFAGAVVEDRNFRPSLFAPIQVLPAAVGGNPSLRYSLRSDPPGLIDTRQFTDRLSFNVNTRVLEGRPVLADVGAYTMTYEARDANGDAVTLTFRITVGDNAPLFPENTDFFPNQTLTAGRVAATTFPAATPATFGDTLTYTLTSTPPELQSEWVFTPSSSSSRFFVNPNTPGTYTVTYRVVDQNGNSDFRTAIWTVNPNPGMPNFGIGALPDVTYVVGTTHAPVTLRAAVGGNRPLAYSVTSALPAGLSFDAGSRELRGTPMNAGSYETTYRVQDADGDFQITTFTIEAVADSEPDFGTASVAAQTYTMGTAVNLSLPAASGGNPPLSYELSPLPAGLSFDADARVLSGIPTDSQEQTTHAYTVRDRDNDADTLAFAITVPEADQEPAFAAGQPDLAVNLDLGVPVSASPPASEPLPAATGGNQPLRYDITPPLPSGLSFDGLSRTLRGTPQTAAETTHAYRVRDRDDDADTLPLTISVAADSAPSFAGGASIAPRRYNLGERIEALLPEAGGGNGALSYRITPQLPDGLSFDDRSRTLSGTPAAAQRATPYTYAVTDADDNTNPGDGATLGFSIAVQHNIATIVLGGDLEADLVENAPAPEATARGTLAILNDGLSVTAFPTAQTGTPGRYGAFSVDGAGAWTYTLDNARPGLADLNDGQRFTETFHVEARTSLSALAGTIVFGEVRITIIGTTDGGGGANEPAWFGGELAGTLTEDDAAVGGALLIINPDGLNRVEAATATAGAYGTFTITPAGVWNYDLNNELPAIQGLFTAEFKTDTFTVTAADDAGGSGPATMALTITITGVNDAAVFGAQPPVSIDEDAGRVSGMITAGDADGGDMVVPGTTDGALGAFTITAAGAWTYTLTAVAQELVTGDAETERFTVTAADDGDDPATVEVAITVTGVNDPAVFGGDTGGEIGEDAAAPLAGTLTISDADGADTVVAQTGIPGDYGVFTIDGLGAWSYTLGAAAQTLRRDQSPVERFTVTAADDGDGTGDDTPATVDVAVTVNGANDLPAARIIAPQEDQSFASGAVLSVAGEHGDVDAGDPITYQWSTDENRGSFADATAASTTWTAPVLPGTTNERFILRFEVSDDGGTTRSRVGRRVEILGTRSNITIDGDCVNPNPAACTVTEDGANVLDGELSFSSETADPAGGFAFIRSSQDGDVAGVFGTYLVGPEVRDGRAAGVWTYTPGQRQSAGGRPGTTAIRSRK